jgi:hypothetical protein
MQDSKTLRSRMQVSVRSLLQATEEGSEATGGHELVLVEQVQVLRDARADAE